MSRAGAAQEIAAYLAGPDQAADWRNLIAAILAGLAAATDAVSEALDRASHGLERSHRW